MTEAWHDFPLITQLDGSAFAGSNCAPTSWANMLVSQQRGHRPAKGSPWYPSGRSLRNQSGDTSGGITPSLLDYTVNRVYGIDNEVRIATLATVQQHLDDGYAMVVLLDYSAISAAGMSGSPGFGGAHSITVVGTKVVNGTVRWLDGDPLYDGRRAGIPKGWQWIDRSVILRAAQDLSLGNGMTVRQQYGPGMLYVVFAARPSAQPPLIVENAPATDAQKRYKMIAPAWRVTSGKVMRLQAGQPLFKYPGGPRVTKVSGTRPVSVSFLGYAGPNWAMVLVNTAVPYKDGVLRPTGVYVPRSAGPVSNR